MVTEIVVPGDDAGIQAGDRLPDEDRLPERPAERTRRYQQASKAGATWRA